MADNVALTMARRLDVLPRAQSPRGVVSQGLRMAMNAREHRVEELS